MPGLDPKLLRATHQIAQLIPNDKDLATSERAIFDVWNSGYRGALSEACEIIRYFVERHKMSDERRTGFAQALDMLEGMFK